MYRRSKRLYGNSDGKLRDDRGDRDDRDRPDRTLLYPGDRDDRVKFTYDHMETVNRPDRLHTISSDRGHWGDRGDYMETRLYHQIRCEFDRLAYGVLWGFKIIQDALKIIFYNVI